MRSDTCRRRLTLEGILERLRLTTLDGALAVVRLGPGEGLPDWLDMRAPPLCSVTWTGEELSLVVPERLVPASADAARGWRALKVEGPLDFALTGILLSIPAPLAVAGVSVFAVSTFDTDYVLVRSADLDGALAALRPHFHVRGPDPDAG